MTPCPSDRSGRAHENQALESTAPAGVKGYQVQQAKRTEQGPHLWPSRLFLVMLSVEPIRKQLAMWFARFPPQHHGIES